MSPSKYFLTAAVLFSAITSGFAVYPATSENEPLQIFILAGQSNAVGFGDPAHLSGGSPYLSPQTDVGFWHNTSLEWGTLQYGTGDRKNAQNQNVIGGGFGPELSAGLTLANALGDDVAILKYAIGSSYLAQTAGAGNDWSTSSSGELYDQLLAEITAATSLLTADGISFEIAGVFWMQGENDATVQANANAYEANLTDFIGQLRLDLGQEDLPFIIGRLSDSQTKPSLVYRETVQAAQDAVASDVDNVYIFNTDDLTVYSDLVHFSTNSQISLGEKFANTYITEAIPEPSSVMLLGFGALVFLGRRRK